MRFLRVLLFSLPLLFAAARGVAWEDDEPRAQIEFGYRSGAIERGIDLTRHGVHGAVEFAASGWHARGARHEAWGGGEANINTLQLSRAWVVADEYSIETRIRHERIDGVGGFGRRHATQLGLAVARTLPNSVKLSLRLDRDWRTRAWLTELRLTDDYALTRWGAFLEWSVFAGLMEAESVWPDAAGPRRGDGFAYAGVDFRLPYRVGERTMVVATASFAGTRGASALWSPRGHENGLRAQVGVTLTVDF